MPDSISTEGRAIRQVLQSHLPTVWEGREAILVLKEADYQWRQMEWIGWFFEYQAKRVLMHHLGGGDGPSFGRTAFDYRRHHVWDLKAHVTNSGQEWAVLNDQQAIQRCIQDYGGVGFVVACGTAGYDADGSFKKWHDDLKGECSNYEAKRILRGAPSRRRKTQFNVQQYCVFAFSSRDQLAQAVAEGWIGGFQEGMRNADGSPRRAKYKVKIGAIPANRVI